MHVSSQKHLETINPNHHHLLFFFFFFLKIIKWKKRRTTSGAAAAPNRSCCREGKATRHNVNSSLLLCVSDNKTWGLTLSLGSCCIWQLKEELLCGPQPDRQTHTGPQHWRVTWEDFGSSSSRENQDGRTSSSWLFPFFSAPRRVPTLVAFFF